MKIKQITQIILDGLSKLFDDLKDKIKELASLEIEGKEKKKILDEFAIGLIYEYIIQPINFIGFDKIIEPKIKDLLEKFVPVLTQKLYDLMASKFDL